MTGRIDDYYEKRKDYHKKPKEGESEEKFKERTDEASEKRRIRRADIKGVNNEGLKWRSLGIQLQDTGKLDAEMVKIILKHRDLIKKLFELISESWLDKKSLEELENQRYQARVKELNEQLQYFERHKRRINPEVKETLERHINELPKIWESIKTSVQEKAREKETSKKVAKLLELSNYFYTSSYKHHIFG